MYLNRFTRFHSDYLSFARDTKDRKSNDSDHFSLKRICSWNSINLDQTRCDRAPNFVTIERFASTATVLCSTMRSWSVFSALGSAAFNGRRSTNAQRGVRLEIRYSIRESCPDRENRCRSFRKPSRTPRINTYPAVEQLNMFIAVRMLRSDRW